jgi:hypothetical protein
MFFGPQIDENTDGQGTPWNYSKGDIGSPFGCCSTIELPPRLMEQVGLEPTTNDNPQLRPIVKQADKKTTVELPDVLLITPPSQAMERICTDTSG